MIRVQSSSLLRRVAHLFAAIYLLCTVTPALTAISFDPSLDGQATHVHLHDDGIVDHHHSISNDGPNDHADHSKKKCCGIFCHSALPSSEAPTLDGFFFRSFVFETFELTILGSDPDQLNRPPIYLLSF